MRYDKVDPEEIIEKLKLLLKEVEKLRESCYEKDISNDIVSISFECKFCNSRYSLNSVPSVSYLLTFFSNPICAICNTDETTFIVPQALHEVILTHQKSTNF